MTLSGIENPGGTGLAVLATLWRKLLNRKPRGGRHGDRCYREKYDDLPIAGVASSAGSIMVWMSVMSSINGATWIIQQDSSPYSLSRLPLVGSLHQPAELAWSYSKPNGFLIRVPSETHCLKLR